VNGAGHTITAHDPGPGVPFSGAVLTNDPAGHTMTIEALTVRGTGFVVNCAPRCRPASSSMTLVAL
jgi:hypothetical protein